MMIQLKQLISLQCNLQLKGRSIQNLIEFNYSVVFSFFGILLVLSTSYDLYMKHVELEPNKILMSFSVYTNGKNLFDITEPKSPNSINSLLGMRAISVLWIMFGHRFLNQQLFPMTNTRTVLNHYNYNYSVILSAYDIAVDTFFVMGALLMTISTLSALEKQRLNILQMILHRYIRYTPVFAALILYIVSIAKFTTNGPIQASEIRDACGKYWWSALLHVQNYVNPDKLCAGHTWYLSADFQLFVISPFLIYPAWRWGWKYLWSLPVLALMSSIYLLTISLLRGFTVLSRYMGDANEFNRLIYYATHGRLGPWLIGIVLGFILHKFKGKDVKLSKGINSLLWTLCLIVLTTIVVLAQPLNQRIDNRTSLLSNAFYIAFHRLFWAIGISWIIFACQILKTGGFIRWFLSLPHWQPIGRMSLSMYLIHLFYQFTTMVNQKVSFHYEIWLMVSV